MELLATYNWAGIAIAFGPATFFVLLGIACGPDSDDRELP